MDERTNEEEFVVISNGIHQELKKSLTEFKNQITALSKNPIHHFETILDFGQLVDSVNELVNHKSLDLVVMGTKGGNDG